VPDLEPRLELGEVVNAVGRVRARRGQAAEIVVESAADIRRAATFAGVSADTTGHGTFTIPAAGVLDRSIVDVVDPEPSPAAPALPWPALVVGLTMLSAVLLGGAALVAWRSMRSEQPRPA
jgi:hypothetical protein